MRRIPGLRALGMFWFGLLALAGAGIATLTVLGPPGMPAAPGIVAHDLVSAVPAPVAEHRAAWELPRARSEPEHAAVPAAHAPIMADAQAAEPAAVPPGRVAGPDAALQEPSVYFWPAQLPRVAADGRTSRTVYAAPAPAVPKGTPRVALLVSGFGLSDKDSRAALDALPAPVSLAVSAYAGNPAALLDAARAGGHELLASIPMEPLGWPLNDEGEKSLRTGLSAEQNRMNLEWALSRTPGVVGATAASDGMRGERFAEVSAALAPVLDMIGRRGLLYVDPLPGHHAAAAGLATRTVDMVIDDTMARAEIEARLVTLETEAKERGQALGLAGPLRPVTVQMIAAWTKTLAAHGIVLVPVSALSVE